MSAPTQKTNGLPVTTSPAHSPPSSSSRRAASDSSASRPNTFGFCQSSPLSIVRRASGPASVSTRASLNSRRRVAQARSQSSAAPMPMPMQSAVSPYRTSGRSLEPVRELGQQPNAGRGQRMSAGDRAAVGVQPRVVGRDAHPVAPAQHLHGEGLVQLEEADVVDRQARLLQHAFRRRNRPDPHQLRLDAGEREPDEPHPRRQAQLGRGRPPRPAGTAVAPSVRPAEFPAVTRPPTRNGVGRSARPSRDVSGRRN